jgi:hypothetical protein
MESPQWQKAVMDKEKLESYCLNPLHPRGRNKARVFASVLGLTQNQSEILRKALLAAIKLGKAIPTGKDVYGQRYQLDFEMEGIKGTATVRSLWIIRAKENFPRLSSCYILLKRRKRS